MGGKSASATVGYKQYAGAALVLAKLVHRIKNIKIGDVQAWAGTLDGAGTISINLPKLFGSSGTEGGFVGDIQFQPGLPTQTANAYLLSKLGPHISANRGVSQVVLPQPYLGNNPYIKDFEFLCERIHLLDGGATQWYDAKAAIVDFSYSIPDNKPDWRYLVIDRSDTTDYSAPAFDDSGWQVGAAPFGDRPDPDAGNYGFTTTPGTVVPQAHAVWMRTTINIPNLENDFIFEAYVDNGVDFYVGGVKLASTYITSGGYYTVNIAKANFKVGLNSIAARGTDDTIVGPSGTFYFSWRLRPANTDINDINPAHMLRECLTNTEWGYGYDVADIDDASFTAAADKLYAESFGIGYFWDDDQTQLADIIEKIQEIVDGNLFISRTTLKWTFTLIRNDYDASTLPILTVGNEVLSITDYSRAQFLDLVNEVVVNYYDATTNGNGSISSPNPALFLQQGVKVSVTKDFDMCSKASLAAVLGQRELNVVSQPFSSCKVNCNSAAKNYSRGTVFKLTSPRHNYNQTIMRVTSITRGDSTTQLITLTCVEDKFGLPAVGFVDPQPSAWVDPASSPVAIVHQIAMEIPYVFLLGQDSQTNIDAEIAANPDMGYYGIAAARVPGALSADIFADIGAGYVDVAIQDFCPYGELSTALDYLTATFTLANYEDLDELVTGQVAVIDSELISWTGVSGGVFTGVKRGCLDSVPTKHAIGARVYFLQNYLDGPNTQFAAGEHVNIKLATNAALGQLPLASAPVSTVTFASRAISPYPPGALKLNGTAYLATINGALTVTWASRNRQSQADTIVDTTQASVTPEVNTRYTLQFYNASNVLIIAQSSIGPPTAGVVLNYTGNVTLKLWAVSDNGASIQQHSFTFAYTPPSGTTASTITATAYTPIDNSTIIDGGTL